MTSHMNKKHNRKVKNVKRAAYIKYQLYRKGLTLNEIAKDLHVSNSAVYRSINGLSKITRVDEWLQNNIGLEVING